ncbi:MAG: hypothetical protein EAZ35_11460 [Sphingobacteriia bacterium]|nr:MAG: hypothetical protein EAZ35_11460 [Sphingobacteriia bacterium]
MKAKMKNLGLFLSRDAQKKLIGGDGVQVPTDDIGGTDNGWKCCWTGTNNCSVCAAYGSCVSGASQVKC